MNNIAYYGVWVALAGCFLLNKIANLKYENTQLRINIAETELHYSQQMYQKMLKDIGDLEIDWERSGIGSQKRSIQSLTDSIELLKAKRVKFYLFFG